VESLRWFLRLLSFATVEAEVQQLGDIAYGIDFGLTFPASILSWHTASFLELFDGTMRLHGFQAAISLMGMLKLLLISEKNPRISSGISAMYLEHVNVNLVFPEVNEEALWKYMFGTMAR
jgi:hypothetical protein